MTDIGFENLKISDRHHDPASENELPSHQIHSGSHMMTGPPGIQVEGVIWDDGAYQEEDDDDQPLSQQQGAPRPLSVRNQAAVQINSMRPARFIKADHQATHPAAGSVPPEMQPVQHLYELFLAKTYMEGYLYRKNESKRPDHEAWIRSYVELSGPVLTMWDADQEEGEVLPHYLNISDASAELNDQGNISLKAGGANRYLFEVDHGDERIVLDWWLRAIRLSIFEGSRIHEIYTKKIIMRHKNAGEDGNDDEDLLAKPIPKMEGFLQVRFGGGNDWQKYWVVVSDRRDSKKLFGKKSVPSRGQLMFYESKRSKQPIKTLTNISQAYTIYPETPQLIDMATLLKADGVVGANEDGEGGQPASVLMMTSSTRELVQWLVGVFDAFKLYGRPSQLLRDPTNPNSLNFGESVPGYRLFLEIEDLGPMDVHEDTMAKNRVTMTNAMFNKFKQPGAAAGQTGQSSGGMGVRTNSMPQIAQMQSLPAGSQTSRQRAVSADTEPKMGNSGISHASMYGVQPPQPAGQPSMMQHQQQQRTSAMPPRTQGGKIIYASDDSDEEDEEVDDSEDDDDDSVFGDSKPQRSPTNANLPVPTTSGTSYPATSTSEIRTNSDRESRISDRSSRNSDRISDVVDTKKSPRLKVNPSPSLSGSDDESEEDNDDESDISDGEYMPHQPKSRFAHSSHMNNASSSRLNTAMPPPEDEMTSYDIDQQQHQQMMDMYGYHGYQQQQYLAVDEDGPIIPQLGEDFANPNSLLGSVRNDHGASIRDQAEYAKATGQPLIQVAQKQTEPRGGLVGMISQIEHEKKDHKNRRLEAERERMMERERFMAQQQQQQQQSMMGNPMMGMMDPRMTMMQPNMMMGGMMMPMMDPRMSMMAPNMMMMPMMDPRMSMMPSTLMGGNSAAGMTGGNQHASMMMPPSSMAGGNPHASMMMPPGTMAGSNQHASMMMPPMMDPRMSMMTPNMMMYGMWNNGYNNSSTQFGINEEDDEDDDLPLGATNPTKSSSTSNRAKK
ncbi:hypothetical protein BX666DRAFT_662239 [Dichotomocladium elegans]|nr:hypothetical protein BX666DRAFT_662239 [Dichotomocladium elegans]